MWASNKMSLTNGRTLWLGLALVVAVVVAAYANHFSNDFHFDDTQTVTANVYIRQLANIPQFFKDATTFSAQVGGQTWRPIVSTSLAIDYWLAGGLKPFFFHLSTLIWFLVQLVLMFFLFRRIMDGADRHPSNGWTALLAVACYGLHPANAETVNYIVQRADVYCTLGVVASLLWFAAYPAQRKRAWYLIPAVLAYLSKAPALIFPLILLAYVFLLEEDCKWRPALRAAVPALAVTAAAAILTARMTPASYTPGAESPSMYRITQPWIALRYFKNFFLPTGLSADTDWGYVPGVFSGEALAGYLFVALLIAVAVRAARRPDTRPVAFGIAWFFLALLPVALFPLAEVANDHRMFFPFVGLALAVFWALRLALFRITVRLQEKRIWLWGALAAAAVILAAAGVGTHGRNAIWRTEESLWRDVTVKSPKNARGLYNYGSLLLAHGNFAGGVPYLEQARTVRPDDSVIELRLANAYAGVGRDEDAGRHYERAVALAPGEWAPAYFFGRWLHSRGRMVEAQAQIRTAMKLANRQSLAPRYLLMQLECEQRDWPALDTLIAETLELTKGDDEVARGYSLDAARQPPGKAPAPEALLNAAAGACSVGMYEACLRQARQALAIRPNYAEAYYVAAGALAAGRRKADVLHALRMAIRIEPDFEAAKRALTVVE